jgi:predicted alpha/beta superfamily hydrolase
LAFDGDAYFGFLTDITRNLGEIGQEIAPPLVVGLGYGGKDPNAWHTLRAKDLTPTPPGRDDIIPEAMSDESFGGLDAYLDQLETIFDVVNGLYPINPRQRVLFGHSFGGLAALHTRFTRPELFTGHLAVSPSIYWGGRAVLEKERPTGQLLHIAVGQLEEQSKSFPGESEEISERRARHVREARMVAEARELAQRLKAAGDPVEFSFVEDETHVGVVYAALPRAFRQLFPVRPA